MATPVLPYSLKTASVSLAIGDQSTDFSDHIDQVSFSPTTSTQTWTAVSGHVISDISKASWAVTFGLVQDLDAAGLLRWLMTNEGKKATATIQLAKSADTITVDVTVAPAGFGGSAGGEIAQSDVTLPCDGQPVWA